MTDIGSHVNSPHTSDVQYAYVRYSLLYHNYTLANSYTAFHYCNIFLSYTQTDLPEVVKEQVKKFKYRYTTRDKRKSCTINPSSYPSPDTVISWDNSEMNDHLTSRQNQLLPSYNFRQYSAALKNGSSMFSPLPLHDSRNQEGQSSASRCHSDQDPNDDQTMDATVQNILSNLRGGTTSANFGTPLNGGQQSGSQSTPEPIDLTQDDDEMSNVTAGNHHVAVVTTAAMDAEVDQINMIMSPAYDDHAPMTSDPALKPLPRSFHMPPAEFATRTKTDSIPDSVESNMNTKQNSQNSDTTSLMRNDTVSCDLNAHTPTLVTGGSKLGAPTNIGTRTYCKDGNGKIVLVPGTANVAVTKSRGEGAFPVGLRFVLRPLISEKSLETTAASNVDGTEESDNQYNNVLDKDTQEELNAVTTVTTTASSSIFSVSEDISTDENGGQSIYLGDETTACVVLPSDYEMSQGYSVDLHMVDGVSLINGGGDNGESKTRTSVTYGRPLADTNILYSSSQPFSVSTSSGPNTTTGSIVSNTPVISNSASGGNFTEIERSLAAEFLRFTPRTYYRTKIDKRRLALEEFVFEMAGFDLPVQIATEKDVLMEADAHMIVYEPNHACYSRFPRSYRRKNVTPSNDDLISRHFALSQVTIPPVRVHVFTDKIINAAIVGDYHFRLQVYASYDILIYDTYCPKSKNQQVAKPWKLPTTTGQKKSTTGGNRKRKNIETPINSPQPKKAKRTYVQKKGAASKTVEDDAYCPKPKNQQVAKPRKLPTTTGQKKSTTGGSRKRKNIETPNSPQPKAKRTYIQKKGVVSKTVEDDAYCPKPKNQQVAKPRKLPTTTGQKKSTTGGSRKRKNIETPNSPQPKKAKRTYIQKKGAASEDVAPGDESSMAAAKKCTELAKGLQRTRKQTKHIHS